MSRAPPASEACLPAHRKGRSEPGRLRLDHHVQVPVTPLRQRQRIEVGRKPSSRSLKSSRRPLRSTTNRLTSTSARGRLPVALRPQYFSSTMCGALAEAGTDTIRTYRDGSDGLTIGGPNWTFNRGWTRVPPATWSIRLFRPLQVVRGTDDVISLVARIFHSDHQHAFVDTQNVFERARRACVTCGTEVTSVAPWHRLRRLRRRARRSARASRDRSRRSATRLT